MRAPDLIRKLNDQPFRPFRIHLSDGTAIPVREPGMIMVGRSSAVVPTEFGVLDGEKVVDRWRTISIDHIVQFADLDEPAAGRRARKRG
jgi:hypothetical protein